MPQHLRARSVQVCAVIAVFALTLAGRAQLAGQSGGSDPSGLPLLQQWSLTYAGTFRVPPGSTDLTRFDYGGTALAYWPAHNSLVLVGHDNYQRVGEISIPTPVNSTSLSALPTASTIQPLSDALGGKLWLVSGSTGSAPKIGGILPTAASLIISAYIYYDGTGAGTLSHFRASQTLSKGSAAKGPFPLGTHGAGFVGGYMLNVPSMWQSQLGGPAMTGQCCIPIISRSSYGPSLSVFDPANVGVVTPVPATMVLGYPSSNPLGDWGSTGLLFNGSTAMGGAVFPDGTRSVLFFGRQGIGTFCYGQGTSTASLGSTPVPDEPGVFYCYDPTDGTKGNHAYPYAYQVWAYDVNDLISVKNGQANPWDIRPYATWNFETPIDNGGHVIKGVAYDPASARLFLSTASDAGPEPLIQVFNLSTVPVIDTTPPAVASVAPAGGAIAVALGTGVQVTFSEAMMKSSLTTSTVIVTDPLNALVPAALIYDAARLQAKLSPTDPFAALTTYTVTVKGGASGVQDVAGNAMTSDFVSSFTTTAPPAVPGSPDPATGATAVPTTPTLRWTAAAATSYDVRFGVSNPPALVAEGQGAASFAPATLLPGTTYYWQIVARNSAGTASGDVWSLTTESPPSMPGSPSPSAGATDVSVLTTLTWTSAGATSYTVRFGTANPPPTVSGQSGASYTPTSLSSGKAYYWQIVARNSAGSMTGPVWSFTTGAPVPTAPGSPNPAIGAANVSTTAHLKWSASHATSYDVLFGPTNPPALVAPGQSSDSYTPPNLVPSTVYYWQIVARNSAGSTAGAVWSFKTRADTQAPSAPGALVATAVSSSQINLTWTASSDDVGVTSYLIERCQGAGCGTFAQIATSATTAFSDAGLPAATTDRYRVRARDGADNRSGYSNTASAATQIAPPGTVVNVSSVAQLQSAVASLVTGQTVVIAPGTYQLTGTLYLPQGISDVTIKGSTGKRDDVVIAGAGMNGAIPYGFWTGAVTNATFADLTLRNFSTHGLIFNQGAQSPRVRNLHIVDIGDQFIKVNPLGINNGLVENSLIEYSTVAPDTYTNGVDIHNGANWIIRNNTFRNIRSTGGLAGPAVLVWDASADVTVTGNTFIDNQRDISLGLDPAKTALDPVNNGSLTDNLRGVIANNMIVRNTVTAADVAIAVFDSPQTLVYYNTILTRGGYPNAIEYRFTRTAGVGIANNLSDAAIVARDGAVASVASNVTQATPSMFTNPAAGDLHLLVTAAAARGQGQAVSVTVDIDGQARPAVAPDVGADEY